jgi:hypothetical protein
MKTRSSVLGLALAVTAFAGGSASASNLVQNGTFAATLPNSALIGDFYNYGSGAYVADWDTNGYNFLFYPTTADTTGADQGHGYASPDPGFANNLYLWGPGTGSNNGFSDPPSGDNFIAADGDYINAPITQTINGLTAGKTYDVTFSYAYSQQYGYYDATQQNWTVALGGSSYATSTITTPSQGFTPWQTITVPLTADSSSDTLSFLATGSGAPPFALLADVSLTAVPEPSTWALVVLGFAGLGFAAYRRKRTMGSVFAA